MRDVFGGQYEIYAPAFDCALWHIRLDSSFKFLRYGYATYVFDATQRRCAIAIITRDYHGDELAVPVLGEGTQEDRNHVRPASRL